jgi:integrase
VKDVDAARSGLKVDTDHTVRMAANKWIEEHLPTLRKGAIRRYDTSLGWLLPYFGHMRLRDIGSKELYAFEQHRRKMRPRKNSKQRISPVTIKRDLACLSSIFSSAEEWEWIKHNPVKPFLRARKKKRAMVEAEGRSRYLHHDEEKLLLEDISNEDYDRFAWALDTGLRADEQWNILKADIDRRNKRVHVRAEISKSGKQRWVPLLPRAWEITERRLKNNATDFLFWRINDDGETVQVEHTWAWRQLQAVLKEKEIKDVEWHDLRRTCGCRLLQDHRMPIERVSRWLGHSGTKVTQKHYAFLEVEHLESSIDASVVAPAKAAKASDVPPVCDP